MGTGEFNAGGLPFDGLPKHILKKKIQALLFVTLETLDCHSYADASTLISEIKKASYL